MKSSEQLLKNTRRWILFFITALIVSGITAFAIETELKWLISASLVSNDFLFEWLNTVYDAMRQTNRDYPFIAYGFDWLAFAHLVIALLFVGPLIDPVRNVWVVKAGIIASLMIFPLAFIAGYVRQIPFAWQLIDCSFGLFALIPLTIIYSNINRLEKIKN